MNKKYTIEIKLADCPVKYSFLYSKTVKYFKNYTLNEDLSLIGQDEGDSSENYVKLTKEEYDVGKKLIVEKAEEDYIEYKLLISKTSLFLLSHMRCIFHAVAIKWLDRAWLLTGPSGIGKTTQLRHWVSLIHGEMHIISGDMPVLRYQEKEITVYPSPWNGKEGITGKKSAKLGGIIYLEQNSINDISLISKGERLSAVFKQFICLPDTEEQIRTLSEMVAVMLQNYPIWKLKNKGDLESAGITIQAIKKYLDNKK